jgi:hypothetical protein
MSNEHWIVEDAEESAVDEFELMSKNMPAGIEKKHDTELPALVPKFGLTPFCVRSTNVTTLSVLLVKECHNLKLKLRQQLFDYIEGSSRPNVVIGFVSTLNC